MIQCKHVCFYVCVCPCKVVCLRRAISVDFRTAKNRTTVIPRYLDLAYLDISLSRHNSSVPSKTKSLNIKLPVYLDISISTSRYLDIISNPPWVITRHFEFFQIYIMLKTGKIGNENHKIRVLASPVYQEIWSASIGDILTAEGKNAKNR